jgi:hypothetical protein
MYYNYNQLAQIHHVQQIPNSEPLTSLKDKKGIQLTTTETYKSLTLTLNRGITIIAGPCFHSVPHIGDCRFLVTENEFELHVECNNAMTATYGNSGIRKLRLPYWIFKPAISPL